jgi:arginase
VTAGGTGAGALWLFDAGLSPRLRAVLPRIDPGDVAAVGPRDTGELAGLPPPWWLHTDLDVLATGELAAMDYPQPVGLTWGQLAGLTAAALAADGCAGWSVCIYNPDLDPGRDGADAIISCITQAITASDQPAR